MTNTNQFTASLESKTKAKKLRRIALISWLLAMTGQVFAILKLIHNNTLTWLLITM